MELLAQYMDTQGIKQAAMARKLNISQTMMSLILSGQRTPGVTLTKRIETVTGIPRAELRPDIFGDAQ